jgi:hypothetical protein
VAATTLLRLRLQQPLPLATYRTTSMADIDADLQFFVLASVDLYAAMLEQQMTLL